MEINHRQNSIAALNITLISVPKQRNSFLKTETLLLRFSCYHSELYSHFHKGELMTSHSFYRICRMLFMQTSRKSLSRTLNGLNDSLSLVSPMNIWDAPLSKTTVWCTYCWVKAQGFEKKWSSTTFSLDKLPDPLLNMTRLLERIACISFHVTRFTQAFSRFDSPLLAPSHLILFIDSLFYELINLVVLCSVQSGYSVNLKYPLNYSKAWPHARLCEGLSWVEFLADSGD